MTTKQKPSTIYGTLSHFQTTRWNSINARCKSTKPTHKKFYLDKGIKVEITRLDFRNFVENNWYKIQNIYNHGLIPTIDRIDSNKSYTLNNIQIVTMAENISKATKKTKSAPLWAQNMKTGEVTLLEDGRFGAKSREMGFNPRYVWRVLYRWRNVTTYKGHHFILAAKIDGNGSQLDP